MRLLTLFSLLLLLGAGPALAQDEVRLTPGHPDLTPVDVEDQLLAVYNGGPGGRLLGTVTRTVMPNDDGTMTVVTDADASEAGITGQDSSRYGAGLTPVFLSSESFQGSGTVTVSGTNVSGTFTRGDNAPLPFDIDLTETPFDPAAIPLVAQSLPLREGYTAVVPTFSPIQRVRETTLTVVGEEEVTNANGETVMAWVVEEDGRGRDRRFYVDGATRDLVQITISPNEETLITIVPTTEDALAAAAGPEADPIRPGDETLMTDRLGDYTEDYSFKVVQPVQQDIGTITRRMTVDEGAGTVTLVSITQVQTQTIRDSLVAVWPTFEPIARRVVSNENVTELAFADGEIQRTFTEGEGDPETVISVIDEPVFDTGWIQEIVRAMPLAEGYRIAYQGIGPTGEPNVVVVEVTGQEELDGGPAWIVEAVPTQGPPTTYTVDDATREVLKSSYSPQVGVILETVPAEDAASEE